MPVQTLINAIQQLGLGNQAPANIVTAFAATVNGPPSTTLRNYTYVAATFGDTAAEGLLAAMQSAGLAGAAMTYCAGGFDLSNPLTQQKLTAIATAVPSLASVCAALQQTGQPTVPQWQAAGLSAAPVLTDVETALQQIANPPSPPTYNTHGVRLSINQGQTTCLSIVVNQASNTSGWVDGPNVAAFGTGDLANATLTAAQQALAEAIESALATFVATL